MTVGDEAFKKDWMETVLPLYALTMPLSLKAHVYQRANTAKSKFRESLKNVAWIRNYTVRIRGRFRRKKLTQAQEAAKAVTSKIDQAT